jgi:hypothetical protein
MGPKEEELNYLIAEMKKHFKLQEKGGVNEFLGIEIWREDDGGIYLSQPQLIDSILSDLKLEGINVKSRSTPSLKTRILHKGEGGKPFDNLFHYHSILG